MAHTGPGYLPRLLANIIYKRIECCGRIAVVSLAGGLPEELRAYIWPNSIGVLEWRNILDLRRFVQSILFVALALALTWTIGAGADDGKSAPYSGDIKAEKFHLEYEVNPDGSFTATYELINGVLREEGVKKANHSDLIYSTSIDELVILSAYTLKKSGQRIEVPASNIQEREAVAGGGPMFSDLKTKAIIFPDVAVGDKVCFSYKYVRKTPLFPGQFSMSQVFSRFLVYDDAKISLNIPVNSLHLNVFDYGVKGGRIEDKGGRARWEWTFQNQAIAVPEPDCVDAIDYGPRIIVSSFKDYGAIAEAYDERAKPKARVTEKTRALSAELTAGLTVDRDKASALCTWVAKNIRFAGNYMGVGSVVPHEADEVLANRVGDCKDHVVLLQSLLAAAEIESLPVLINHGSSYKLPDVASPRVLDHVIIYLPGFDLYFDPTQEFFPFGSLPWNLLDKPAVHTCNFTGVRHTPKQKYELDTSSTRMVLNYNEDGSADGEVKNEETGFVASVIRAVFSKLQPNMEDLFMRTVLERGGFTGTAKLSKSDPLQPCEKYTYGVNFHINSVLNLPGPGAVLVRPVFSSAHPVAGNLSGLNLPERTLDFTCSGNISAEEYTLIFPKNVKIMALPKETHLDDGRVKYDSQYRLDGNTVTVVRRLEDRTGKSVCTPEEGNAYRAIANEIFKDLKSQIIFQPAEG